MAKSNEYTYRAIKSGRVKLSPHVHSFRVRRNGKLVDCCSKCGEDYKDWNKKEENK